MKNNSIIFSTTMYLSILLLSVTVVFFGVYLSLMDNHLKENRNLVVKEQINIILKSSEYRLFSSKYREISQSIYRLSSISEVILVDKDCVVLHSIPFSRTEKCPELNDGEYNYIKAVSLSSNLDGIFVKVNDISIFEQSSYFINILFILGYILIVLSIIYFILNKKLLVSVLRAVEDIVRSNDSQSSANLSPETPFELAKVNDLLVSLNSKNTQLNKTLSQNIIDKKTAEITKQVAHDIRSPLEALKSILTSIESLESAPRSIITNSIGRISDIANELLADSKIRSQNKGNSVIQETNVRMLLESILLDKKYEYNTDIIFKHSLEYSESFVKGDDTILYRCLSNLINNAIEASSPNSTELQPIEVCLLKHGDNLKITMTDYGQGMDQELLERIQLGGVSTKDDGNGLGVRFCKNQIEGALEGELTYQSRVGVGTTVNISLRTSSCPKWFYGRITIPKNSKRIVCIDDDASFREVYKSKLRQSNLAQELVYMSERSLTRAEVLDTDFVLIDYDLGLDSTGLDFILKHKLQNRSLLITSMYDDELLQNKCIESGIFILPKQIFNNCDVRIKDARPEKVSILIDDDSLIQMSWKMAASKAGEKLKCFSSLDEFIKIENELSKSSTIYIDSNLGHGVKGEVEAEKIYNLGFENIHLATGYSSSDFDEYTWIKSVVGKRAPF